jgi:hypothetical protein
MKIDRIQCTRSEEHADRWSLIDEHGNCYPYSKNFKDRSVNAWLERGHMIGHKLSKDGNVETWTFID